MSEYNGAMISVAIQAGGPSRRMGRDKALVPLLGKPLIEHVLDRVEGLGAEVIITTNAPEKYSHLNARLASDRHPGRGALAGLQTALHAALGDAVLVLGCDMPFLNLPLLKHLISLSSQADVIIPKRSVGYEPLHALYSSQCLPAVDLALAAGERKVIAFFPHVRVLVVDEPELSRFDPQGLSFFNINTPEDLLTAEGILASKQAG